MRLFAVGLVLLAGGCVSVESFKAPDGRTAYVIECNGGLQSMAACYNRAAEVCGGEYDVLDNDQSVGVVGTGGNLTPAKFRTLAVACKA